VEPRDSDASLDDLLLEPATDVTGLRQCVLAVCVIDDVDLLPLQAGVLVDCDRADGTRGVLVRWDHVESALAGAPALSDLGRERASRLLRLARDLGPRPAPALRDLLRPVGLPAEHVLHPGVTWLCEVPMGCALGLGLGLLGVEGDPDVVTIPPPGLLECLGVDVEEGWRRAKSYLEEMGAIAAVRLVRDPMAPLRPMGDCDSLTLLGSAVFRSALVEQDGVGVRAVAVPMRRRGWVDPDHVDAVFARAAAGATAEPDRGFLRPVLVTPDGVWEAVDGDHEHALELALREQSRGDAAPRYPDRYKRL
jgi:hypothetical protein